MTALPSAVMCSGCGWVASADDPYPFRCPRAGDKTDHVMTVVFLDPRRLQFPRETTSNPFVRYRTLLHSHHLAMAHGLRDAAYVEMVETLDAAVAQVDGRGFIATPFAPSPSLRDALRLERGSVWVKDETGNVSGSHKARHLMGLLLHLEVVERVGLVRAAAARRDLAIASCGNAALAAAVVARAGGRTLRVFLPTTADPKVVVRLDSLGAQLTRCPRPPDVPGDPTYHELQQAVHAGALPFTCQGSENGLAIEGGKTIGYEMVAELIDSAAPLDRIFIQVGGGALASAVVQAWQEAVRLGVLPRLPRVHAVQTEAVHPLARAYGRVARRILRREGGGAPPDGAMDDVRASAIATQASSPGVTNELRYAATHRAEFMQPWEREPHSLATGILDDETYDWLAVVGGMIGSGGYPVVVSEQDVARANRVAREATGINVDPTGSAGLAGLMSLRDEGVVGPDEHVAVLFTGVQR